ncbi:MAG: hypothetical protein EOM37_06880 [Proteobacteria bacterium]|jgi:fructokinase|nr:PfkB family carbohydrate kinase [Alphaproteobacteria bacterium]NCC03752.1 hypothetical protein [Pseudomonadota bacterium]
MAGIYFCGEVVADFLEQTQGSGNFRFFLGGSHFNGAIGAARAVKREGLDDKIKVGFIGPISQDMFGQRFYAALQENGIVTDFVTRVPLNTTLAVVSTCPGKENDFSFYSTETAAQVTGTKELPQKLRDSNDGLILFLGSISTVMSPARDDWHAFCETARNHALCCYDLNARPSIAKDSETYREIVLQWAKISHIMKASDADIGWAYPDKSMEEIAKLWLEAGASLVIFTKGMHGSEAFAKGVHATATTLNLIATNTVGAGDNFNAGLGIALAQKECFTAEAIQKLTQKDLEDILKGANENAAYHLVSIGAKPRAST